jgi:spermidine synthase
VLVTPPPGGRIVEYREGVVGVVSVIEEAGGTHVLRVNNRYNMGGTNSVFAEHRQAHVPLLLHPAPRRALFLGVGTGITAEGATSHPGLAVTAVELVPEVLAMRPWFEHQATAAAGSTLSLTVADARRFVRASDEQWDVVVADLFHPARDGAGALYTVEHFEAARARLAPGGLFCQWLPLHQLDLPTLRVVVRTFRSVFPEARGFVGDFNVRTPILGLVGQAEPIRYPAGWYDARVADATLRRAVEVAALSNELTLLGCFLAGPDQLASFAGDGPLNTDDHPVVVHMAPRLEYRKDEPHWARLAALLEAWTPAPGPLLAPDADPAFVDRVARYARARDLYLRSVIRRAEGFERAAIRLLLESAATSRDFRTAYVMALRAALERRGTDRETALRILRALVEANPDDPRAAAALRRHFGGE